MRRAHLGIGLLLFLVAPPARGDSAAIQNCISAWTTSCSKDCATAKCVSNCATQAHDQCTKDLTIPQRVFSGPVTATPLDPTQCTPPATGLACQAAPPIAADATTVVPTSPCSSVSGAVANKAFWGGNVTIWVVCPPGAPAGNPSATSSTTVIGSGQSSCADGSFTFIATNACAGQTGCYGLIAATPPASCEACGSCGTASTPGDPGWNTCTSSSCPSL